MEKAEYKKQIGRNIKSMRIRKDLTQEELANKADVTVKTIKNWEKGSGIDPYDIHVLAKIFKCNIDDFYLI